MRARNPDIIEAYQFIRITLNPVDAVELAHWVKAMDYGPKGTRFEPDRRLRFTISIATLMSLNKAKRCTRLWIEILVAHGDLYVCFVLARRVHCL